MNERELNGRSVRELRDIAQEHGVAARSRMRKSELIDAILAARALMGIEARVPETPDGSSIPDTEAEAEAAVPVATGELEVESRDVSGAEVHAVEATPRLSSPGLEIAMDDLPGPAAWPEPPLRAPEGDGGAVEEDFGGAVDAVIDEPPPTTSGVYLDRGPAVPERYPGKRLRAMVRDPATVYVYWEIPELEVEGWEVNALDTDNVVIDSFRTDGRGRSGYLRVPSGTRGLVLLSPLAGGEPITPVAAASFRSAEAAPSADSTELWVHVPEGGPGGRRQVEPGLPPGARSAWDQQAPPMGSSGHLGGGEELPTALRGVSSGQLPSSTTLGPARK